MNCRQITEKITAKLPKSGRELLVGAVAMTENCWHICECPFGELADNRHKRLPQLRQLIFHPNRHLGIHRALHKCIGFEHLKRARKHLCGNVGNQFAELVESRASVLAQHDDYKHCPLASEACHYIANGASLKGEIFFKSFCRHNALIIIKSEFFVTYSRFCNLLQINEKHRTFALSKGKLLFDAKLLYYLTKTKKRL